MAKNQRMNNSELNYRDLVPSPKSEEQREMLRALKDNDVIFVHGPAGSGKTLISTMYGVSQLLQDNFKRVILTRPCVEANGEKLGFLPGDIDSKIAPYMIPVLDILEDYLRPIDVKNLFSDGMIKAIPLGFLRGITFKNAFVLADETQNMTIEQMRLLVTRIGDKSKLVIAGDLNQSDIHGISGLKDAIGRFAGIDRVKIIELTEQSIFRSPLVIEFERRYKENGLKIDN